MSRNKLFSPGARTVHIARHQTLHTARRNAIPEIRALREECDLVLFFSGCNRPMRHDSPPFCCLCRPVPDVLLACALLFLPGGIFCPFPARGQATENLKGSTPEAAHLQTEVRRLGSQELAVRAQAARHLQSAGPLALPALREAEQSATPQAIIARQLRCRIQTELAAVSLLEPATMTAAVTLLPNPVHPSQTMARLRLHWDFSEDIQPCFLILRDAQVQLRHQEKLLPPQSPSARRELDCSDRTLDAQLNFLLPDSLNIPDGEQAFQIRGRAQLLAAAGSDLLTFSFSEPTGRVQALGATEVELQAWHRTSDLVRVELRIGSDLPIRLDSYQLEMLFRQVEVHLPGRILQPIERTLASDQEGNLRLECRFDGSAAEFSAAELRLQVPASVRLIDVPFEIDLKPVPR